MEKVGLSAKSKSEMTLGDKTYTYYSLNALKD
jgi:hypothetical protein